MEDEPPEQRFQSLIKHKTLEFSFSSEQKRTDFIYELFSLDIKTAHFSLYLEKKNNVSLLLFCDNSESLIDSENRIKEIAYNLNHNAKNKWWFW